MRTALLASLLFVALPGCAGDLLNGILLNSQEELALQANMTAIFEANTAAAEWLYMAGTGEVDITGYTYDPPTAQNDWTGTLTAPGGTFPFGDGDLTLTFQATGDTGPVDPYDPAVDLTTHQNVMVDALMNFVGASPTGGFLTINGDMLMDADQSTPGQAVVDLVGGVNVNHNGYITDLNVSSLQATVDTVQGELTDLVGNVEGAVDIPGFLFDAHFDLAAIGDRLDVLVEASLSFFGFNVGVT